MRRCNVQVIVDHQNSRPDTRQRHRNSRARVHARPNGGVLVDPTVFMEPFLEPFMEPPMEQEMEQLMEPGGRTRRAATPALGVGLRPSRARPAATLAGRSLRLVPPLSVPARSHAPVLFDPWVLFDEPSAIAAAPQPRARVARPRGSRSTRHRQAVVLGALAVMVGLAALCIGISAASAAPRRQQVPQASIGHPYIVQRGDSLWSVARSLQPEGDVRMLVHRLQLANGVISLQAGATIVVP